MAAYAGVDTASASWTTIRSRTSNAGKKWDATTDARHSTTNIACAAGNVIVPFVAAATPLYDERAIVVRHGAA